jgi:hypothetical protein
MQSINSYYSALVLIAVLTLTGCGGAPSLDEAPPSAVNLVGTWVSDRSRSDDVRAKLRSIISRRERDLNSSIQRAEKEGLTDEPVGPPPEAAKPGPAGGPRKADSDDLSTVTWLRRQQRLEYEAVIAWLSPPSQLKIEKRDREYRFLSDKGEGTRRFTPGERSAVFNAFGGFDVVSGWDAQTFVVSSIGNGENDISLLERYSLIDDGKALQAVVTVRWPSLGKHELRFIFRRS